MEIDDEKLLEKENLTINNSTKEFNDSFIKTNNLKEKIEKEITKIDKSYDDINNKITKNYEKNMKY